MNCFAGDIIKDLTKQLYTTTLSADNDQVIIGDEKNPTVFTPKLTLTKWNKEVALSFHYKGIAEQPSATEITGEISIGNATEQVNIYPVGSDEMEYEIILKSKPSKNKWDFTIEGYEDLEFNYQTPLLNSTIKDGIVTGTEPSCLDMTGVTRPERVDGSYAVYHKTRKNHITGQTNYKTGKVCNIYRPQAIDNDGNKIWGDISIADGIMTITINQKWLDKAIYPVVIDPNLGYTTVGGTFYNAASYHSNSGFSNTASSNGTMSKIYVYTNTTQAAVKVAVYDGLGTVSQATRLTSSYEIASPTTSAWNSADCSGDSVNVVNGTDYFPALAFAASGHGVTYDSGGAAGDQSYSTGGTYANEMTSTYGSGASAGTLKLSLYLEYTEGGAARRFFIVD